MVYSLKLIYNPFSSFPFFTSLASSSLIAKCLDFLFNTVFFIVNPLTPVSDQDRISPYNINTESSRQVRRIKKKTQLGDYKLIQCQILQIEIISILWQTVGRITNVILGVKGLRLLSVNRFQ